jgi:excisionase family DNA binding protein
MTALADALRLEAEALELQARAKRAQADALDAATPAPVDESSFVTVDEAARALHCSRRTIFTWIADGLPSIRRGRRRRVRLELARQWADGRVAR